MNPAAVPVPVEDVQGDNRWMSQVGRAFKIKLTFVLLGSVVTLNQSECKCNLKGRCILRRTSFAEARCC